MALICYESCGIVYSVSFLSVLLQSSSQMLTSCFKNRPKYVLSSCHKSDCRTVLAFRVPNFSAPCALVALRGELSVRFETHIKTFRLVIIIKFKVNITEPPDGKRANVGGGWFCVHIVSNNWRKCHHH